MTTTIWNNNEVTVSFAGTEATDVTGYTLPDSNGTETKSIMSIHGAVGHQVSYKELGASITVGFASNILQVARDYAESHESFSVVITDPVCVHTLTDCRVNAVKCDSVTTDAPDYTIEVVPLKYEVIAA